MKIVHVISGLTKGGGEKVAVELANTAVQHGDEVTMILGWPEDPAFLQDQIHPGVKVIFASRNKKLAYPKMFPWIIKNRKWLATQDILHCHLTYGTFFGTAVKMLVRFFGKGKPLIVETNHSVGMRIPSADRWRNARMAAMRDGFVLMARDPYWNKFIQNHPALLTGIIPNGIAPLTGTRSAEGRQQLFEKLGIPANTKYLAGTVGMLRPDRAPTLYIPGFKKVYEALGDDVHFIIAGAGPEMEKIQTLISAAGLANKISLPGLINKPAEIILNLDIYVSVSVGETAGISMIEAAMCKLPVVAIQLTQDYKMKEADWVWADTDTKKVGEKIVQLFKDDAARNELATKQYNYVMAHFTASAMYKAYDTFYKKVIEKKSR